MLPSVGLDALGDLPAAARQRRCQRTIDRTPREQTVTAGRYGVVGGNRVTPHEPPLDCHRPGWTVCALIVDDQILQGRLRVAERTGLLLTFGSILDKTAFLFRAQSEFSDVREALASAGQPLISDPAVRPRWVNIFSRNDVLGGSLEYYDARRGRHRHPGQPEPPPPIENVEDAHAWIPLLAHNQYWSNQQLLGTLAAAVMEPRHS